MKRLFLSLILLLCLTGCGSKDLQRVPINYQSGTEDEKSYLYYTDRFFDHPATEYDASLATASLSFAMASFSSTRERSYVHRYQNIEAVLDACGFTDLYANQDFHLKPGADTLGVVIARKALGDKTLLYVGLRGANYESEWASNFTIGDQVEGDYHQGFYESSGLIIEALAEYVREQELSGDLKLWISGYSRAGACANLAAGRMDEMIRDGVSFLGEGVALTREDLYAYCFEAPRGVHFDDEAYPKSDLFNNIFCIINNNDPVPRVVMEALGFCRYGVEVVLPDTVTDLHFTETLEKVKKEYGSLRSFGDWGKYKVSDFRFKAYGGGNKKLSLRDSDKLLNWTQGLYLEELLEVWSLKGVRDRSHYAEEYQTGLRDLFRLLYAHKNTASSLKDLGVQLARSLLLTGEVDVVVDDILHQPLHLYKDLKPLLTKALLQLGVTLDTDDMVHSFCRLVTDFALAMGSDFDMIFSLFSLENLQAIASAHYPELCLAFLRVMDPLYTADPVEVPLDGAYYLLKAPADTDIRVTAEGQVVASFQDGLPRETGSLIPCGIRGDEVLIYLPAHGAYEVFVSNQEGVEVILAEPGVLKTSPVDVETQYAENGCQFKIPAIDP